MFGSLGESIFMPLMITTFKVPLMKNRKKKSVAISIICSKYSNTNIAIPGFTDGLKTRQISPSGICVY
jgi:hypothetical protein